MDRSAGQVLQQARDACRKIEQETEAEKQEILQDAEQLREKMAQQVQAEQAEALEKRKGEIDTYIEDQQQKLVRLVDEKREAWVQEITGRILQP
jgi:hypothetical protein